MGAIFSGANVTFASWGWRAWDLESDKEPMEELIQKTDPIIHYLTKAVWGRKNLKKIFSELLFRIEILCLAYGAYPLHLKHE